MNILAVGTQELTTGQAAAAGAILATFGIFALVIYVLLVIALWRIFVKAGEKGWKSLIPIYNAVIAFRIVGMSGLWVLWTFLVQFATSFIYQMVVKDRDINNEEVAREVMSNPWVIVASIVSIVFMLYVEIRFVIRLSRAFKKSNAFAVGLIFFPNIFTLILGFGSAKYDKKILKA